jgi:hypothetical protein
VRGVTNAVDVVAPARRINEDLHRRALGLVGRALAVEANLILTEVHQCFVDAEMVRFHAATSRSQPPPTAASCAPKA